MIGRIINGKYKIDSVIGSGGMATVYKAHSITDGTIVAIKFLKEENQKNEEYVRRFEREAQAGLALMHGNIVKLLDTGKEDDINYIVFEYVGGPTLKDYIGKRGKFSQKTAVNIVCHILDAIGYAHEHGIIHRDVKPQNVIITTNGAVKLADFGIARAVSASTKTFSGSKIMGSVHYISPEQAAGQEATCQSDLYSVGIILYEMLTGRVPFDNENVVSVALMHLKEEITAPDRINPEITHSLNAVILKATAKDISDRYKSAEEMKNDLLRALREPDGTFADIEMPEKVQDDDIQEQETKEPPKMIGMLNKGVFGAVVALAACIVVLVGAFIIVQAAYNPMVTVQNLVGKSVAEAEELLGKQLDLEIQREASDEEPGLIIRQNPQPGGRLQKGSKIKVVVSIESDHTVAPDLVGMSLTEANARLQSEGLDIGNVVYTESDMEPGTVCMQEPASGEELQINSEITIYISGAPAGIGVIPSVTDRKIDDAVTVLNQEGFTHIMVRYVADSTASEGTVIAQELGKDLRVDVLTPIVLRVSGNYGGAVYDGAHNVTVEESGTAVLITIDSGEGYEIIAYEEIRESGSYTATFTAHMKDEGTYDCIIYVGGVEYKKTTATFSVNE